MWIEFIIEFIKIKTSTSWIIDLMKARHVQSTQKRKFVKFLQQIKKKYHICFCVLLWGKNIQILYRVLSCLLLLIFANIPIVPILPGQSWFSICCPRVPDWINLSRFLYFPPKNVHIYIIFHQQCKTIHL